MRAQATVGGARPNAAAVSSGKIRITRIEVTKMFQVKMGIRNMVIPGQRMHTTVVIMLTAPRMVPRPPTATPRIQRSAPAPGECAASDSGTYTVQPKSAAPPGVMKPPRAISAPKVNNQ